MKTKARKEEPKKQERSMRARPTPRWLMESSDLDAMAQRRCLMVLEVLSGTRPVTEAIQEARISRGTYYQLEERALKAMLAALAPGANDSGPDPTLSGRIASLEEQVKKLETEKRRAERLALLARKLVRPGPLTTSAGRPPGSRNRPKSTTNGPKRSRTSKSTTSPDSSPNESLSTPTRDGAAGS